MLHDPSHIPQIPFDKEIILTKKEKQALQKLGSRIAQIASLPVHKEKARMWQKMNDLDQERSMVWLTSFFMSLMYPTIFATSIKDLGSDTKIGSSVLVMAIIGGALFTPVMGYLAERFNSMAIAMMVPLIAYLYILYFSDYCVNKSVD